MKDKLIAAKQKLTSFAANPTVIYLTGAATGSIATAAVVYYKTKHDYDLLRTLPLGKEAFDALVNSETDAVHFWTGKHEHAFRVILEP